MFTIYATDYAPVDPITPPCDIVPIFIGYRGENKARCLVFDLTECVNTFGDGGFVISFIRQGDELPYLVTDTDRLENNAIWIITDTDTAVDGYGMVQLQYIVDDVVCKSALYRTVTFDSNGIPGDVPDPYEDLLAQIAAYAAQAEGAATTATAAAQTATTAVEEGVKTERSQRIAADEGLNTRINELMGLAGAPSMANSAAAMTDSSKIYVYTGNEAGYLTGHWYYYNGTEWADGGVYQATAINTDKTLTVENMAADAAVVGERIDECMAAFVINSASGDIASFADGADNVPVKDLVVNISPVQSGTGDPSPSNVRAITGWTAANIYIRGTNLWDDETLPGYYDSSGNRQNANNQFCTKNPIPVRPSATVRFIIPFADNSIFGIIECGTDGGFLRRTNVTYYPSTGHYDFTTSADCYYLKVNFGAYYGATYNNDISINYPATDSTYHKYNADSTAYNVSFGATGTVYGGTLDVTTGMLTVTWKQFTFNGSEVWGYRDYGSSVGGYKFYRTIGELEAPGRTNYTLGKFVCNEFVPMAFNYQSQDNSIAMGGVSATADGVFVRKDDITSIEGFQTWLASNPLIVVVNVATPISYQLTPTEVKSLLANNNIWSDTGSVASCEYRADTRLYIEKLTTPDDDMVANANITSGQYFMVGNNLYLATAAIASGASIVPGTNCTLTNLASALNAINS